MFCWFFRLMVSHAVDGDNRLSRTTQEHIRGCADCREFHRRCMFLAEGLKREAAISRPRISEGLSDRILKDTRRQRAEAHKVGIRLRPIAAAACVTLAVLMGVFFITGRRDSQNIVEYRQAVEALQDIFFARDLVGSEQIGRDFPAAWPGLVEEPLSKELKNLTDDTESALQFLVACITVDITDTDAKTNQ